MWSVSGGYQAPKRRAAPPKRKPPDSVQLAFGDERVLVAIMRQVLWQHALLRCAPVSCRFRSAVFNTISELKYRDKRCSTDVVPPTKTKAKSLRR